MYFNFPKTSFLSLAELTKVKRGKEFCIHDMVVDQFCLVSHSRGESYKWDFTVHKFMGKR
jgi:hypothetical protein